MAISFAVSGWFSALCEASHKAEEKTAATIGMIFRYWHEVARHDALLTARKRQFSKPVAFVYLIARSLLRLDNSPAVSAEVERFFSKQSPLAADVVPFRPCEQQRVMVRPTRWQKNRALPC